MARYRPLRRQRWRVLLPGIAGMALIAFLPVLLPVLSHRLVKPDDLAMLAALIEAFDPVVIAALALLAFISVMLAMTRRLAPWQTLVLIGLLQSVALNGPLAPAIMSVTQSPIKALAEIARAEAWPVVSYRVSQPSFSVYRQAVTPSRLPVVGEVVITRRDRLSELESRLHPARLELLSERGRFVLASVRSMP